jgi:hypothetical protein
LVALGLLPVAAGAVGGRWGLPSQGVEQPLGFLSNHGHAEVARVLWLGDPRALPAGGWSVDPGLAYALTSDALPDTSQVLTPAGPGPASLVASAVRLAVNGGTVHLGRLLAPAGVRYVVVLDGLAPSAVGSLPASVSAPPPAALATDLLEQDDLHVVPGEMGVQVYENDEMMPVTAQRALPLPAVRTWSYPGPADVVGWKPVLGASTSPAASGDVAPGTVYAGYAPAASFKLVVEGHAAVRRPAFGWAAQYPVSKGRATFSLSQFPYVPIGVLVEVAAWVVLAAALWRRGRRRPVRESPA